jgi:hypothetical protein
MARLSTFHADLAQTQYVEGTNSCFAYRVSTP